MLEHYQHDTGNIQRKEDEPQGKYNKTVPMGLSTLARCAYAFHRSDKSTDVFFRSFTSSYMTRGGVDARGGLPSRGLEIRLGNGRLLWVANMRICVL